MDYRDEGANRQVTRLVTCGLNRVKSNGYLCRVNCAFDNPLAIHLVSLVLRSRLTLSADLCSFSADVSNFYRKFGATFIYAYHGE